MLGLVFLIFLITFDAVDKVTISGWNWVLACQFLFTGFLLTMMGIIGEYIARIYDEARVHNTWGWPMLVSRVFSIGGSVVINFLGSRFWVFRQTSD